MEYAVLKFERSLAVSTKLVVDVGVRSAAEKQFRHSLRILNQILQK